MAHIGRFHVLLSGHAFCCSKGIGRVSFDSTEVATTADSWCSALFWVYSGLNRFLQRDTGFRIKIL